MKLLHTLPLRSLMLAFVGSLALSISAISAAENYTIDTKGAHAFIQFRIKHLGYSWLVGRFNTFEGEFMYDEKKPEATSINVTIDARSIDSNHAERDKHLRSADFLEVDKFPEATFIGKSYTQMKEGKAKLTGDLTLHGVTKSITIDVSAVGHGKDPWGGYRRGFEGKTILKLKDYNIKMDLGPASQEVEMYLGIEGIRK